jgi:S1-C subfamily serine protease
MKRNVSLLALALLLALSSSALAGGEKCARDAKTAAAHNTRKGELAAKGWLGLKTEKDASGAYRVAAVESGSPAAKAGFRTGDVLVAYNGVALTDANKDAVHKAKAGCSVGTKVAYTVRRDGAERTVTATLAPVPEKVLAEWMKEEAQTGQMAKNGN